MANNRFIDLFEEIQTRRQPRAPQKSQGQGRYSGHANGLRGFSLSAQGEAVEDPDGFVLKIFEYFFPNNGLTRQGLSDGLRDMAATMLWTATEQSRLMDLVPRPPGGVASFSWLAKEAGRILKRWLTNDRLYDAVVTVVRNNFSHAFRAEIVMAQAQSFSGRFAYQHSAISYRVPGIVPVVAQPTGMICWATVYSMMLSWKDAASYSIRDAAGQCGAKYAAMVDANKGLPGSEKETFLRTAGLQWEWPQSLTIDGWLGLLQNYGPIWVTTDEAAGAGNFAIHARIITGMQGGGNATDTYLHIIDPAGGTEYDERFDEFERKYAYENAADGRVQIVHWPAGVSRQQSISRRARPFSNGEHEAEADDIETGEQDDSAPPSYSASMQAANYCPLNQAANASTANFQLAEFHSRDGEQVPQSIRGNVQHLMNQLEALRANIGKPITITSGYRSDAHNRRVGGAGQSRHRCGQAADIKVAGMTPPDVKAAIERLIAAGQMVQGGIGLYPSFVHYDTHAPGGRGRRW